MKYRISYMKYRIPSSVARIPSPMARIPSPVPEFQTQGGQIWPNLAPVDDPEAFLVPTRTRKAARID